jgi:hypothetical protein
MIDSMLEDHAEASGPTVTGCPAAVESTETLLPGTALVRANRAA